MEEVLDKFEKKVRIDQITRLIDKGIYDEALEIADTIDWRNEKSIKTLRVVSEIYKVNKRFEDAFNVLSIAYERDPDDPIKRKIVYDLAEVAIKLNQYGYAVNYLKEYEKLSPNDPGKYMLRYKLLKATGADYSERIELLEEFKRDFFGDFREKWAYELAQLYRSTGQTRQCINACDEIILWFIKGPYVTRAKELKASLMTGEETTGYGDPQKYDANAGLYGARPLYPEGNRQQNGNPFQDPYNDQYREPYRDPYGGSSFQPDQYGQPGQYGQYGQQEQYGPYGYASYDQNPQQSSMQIEVRNVYASNEPTIRMPDRQINNMSFDQVPDEISINLDRDGTINLQEELKGNLDNLSQQIGEPLLQREERIPEPDEGMTELFDTRNMQQDPGMGGAGQYQGQQYSGSDYSGMTYPEQSYDYQPYDGQATAPLHREQAAGHMYEEQPAAPMYDDRQYAAQQPYEGPVNGQPANGQMPMGESVPEENQAPEEYERKFPEDEKAEPGVEELDRADFVKNVPVYRQSPSGETLYRAGDVSKPRVIKKTDFGESLPRMPQQYRNILSEGYDGQINMNVPDEPAQLEKQITGQLDLDTVLLQWKDESNRKRFATITPSQVKREEALRQERLKPSRPPKKDRTEPAAVSEEDPSLKPADEEELTEAPKSGETSPERIPQNGSWEQTSQQPEPLEETPEQQEPRRRLIRQSSQQEEFPKQQMMQEELPEMQMVQEEQAGQQMYEQQMVPESGQQGRPRQMRPEQAQSVAVKRDFTEDEREIYSPFISIGGMAGRLLQVLPLVSMTGRKGNILISGNESTLRIALAQSFAKDIQLKNPMMGIKVAKISAETFNTKDIEKSLRALDGNILVIERAGRLSPGTVGSLLQILDSDGLSILVIMEDSKSALKNLPLQDGLFRRVFNAEVEIPRFTNDDLVKHAQDYAREREYQIDDLAILALYRRIDELQTADHLVTAEEVEDIMEGAIKNVNKKNMAHFMDVLLAKRYNKDDLIIIREKDFEKR